MSLCFCIAFSDFILPERWHLNTLPKRQMALLSSSLPDELHHLPRHPMLLDSQVVLQPLTPPLHCIYAVSLLAKVSHHLFIWQNWFPHHDSKNESQANLGFYFILFSPTVHSKYIRKIRLAFIFTRT